MKQKKDTETDFTLVNSLQKLFQSETRALIAFNLMIYKELTVKELVSLTNKDASTITRNLNKLQDSKLVEISKTNTVRNFNINFWKLSSKIPLNEFGDLGRIITEAILKNDLEFLKTVLLVTQHIIWSILNYKVRNPADFVQNIKEKIPCDFLSLNMMDESTGQLFLAQITDFILKFSKEHKLNLLPIDKISPNSFITFILISQFPSLNLSDS